jgi:hypothetical protein
MAPSNRVLVIDSTLGGDAKPLNHGVFAVVYTPSWLRLRGKLEWTETSKVMYSLSLMKEYFITAAHEEKPIRAQRCLFVVRTLHIFGTNKYGLPRFSDISKEQLAKLATNLVEYLKINPVIAWDWVVSWTESRAMAEAFPNEYVQLFRRLRSKYDTKRSHKAELLYFIDLMRTVAKEKRIDTEYTWR